MTSQFSLETAEEESVLDEPVREALGEEAPENPAALVGLLDHQRQPNECSPQGRFKSPLECAQNCPRPGEPHGSAPNSAQ